MEAGERRRTDTGIERRPTDADIDRVTLSYVFDHASEGIAILDSGLRVAAANPALLRLLNRSRAELIGSLPPPPDPSIDGQIPRVWDAVRNEGGWQGEFWARCDDGQRLGLRVGVAAMASVDDNGRYVAVFSNVSDRMADEERVRRQATHDALTGLPNRALFLDRLGRMVSLAERNHEMAAMLFVDLDGFKLVNDTLGHHMGDLLLQEAAHRLNACVRTSDTVARLGGDEFTVLMPNLAHYHNAPTVAGRILDALKRPFELTGREAHVSASIGITIFPDDARDAATMLKNADAAMYRAKEQGKANFQFFTPDMNAAIEERVAIKTGLERAVERNELMLHFQPKLDLSTGRIAGVEALLRWEAAELGRVSPAKFIPVMEETGLINRVGDWAIEAACLQHRAWLADGLELRVAVNLSVRQLRQPGFVEAVERILSATSCPASGLEFEITESMLMRDSENAVATLDRLSAMGVRLAMDDFGTGYSSLSVLRRFPVDAIKIDGSFIAEITTDAASHEIIHTIISMGHSLGRRVVAEGVETAAQSLMLKRLGCDEIQGYVLSPPLPASEIARLVARHSAGNFGVGENPH